jgi:HAD superfamily hydrolase (TIGR01509 family)
MYIFFDLDGVLVDLKELHRDAYISAWNSVTPEHPIDITFHNKYLEARPTKDKVLICNTVLNTSASILDVNSLKQQITQELLASFEPISEITDTIHWLKSQGHTIACCSNSILKTMRIVLTKLNIYDSFDLILSNEQVTNSKPHPEIYLKASAFFGVEPTKCLVFEDSEVGKQSAISAGCNVIPVIDSQDITIDFVNMCITNLSRIPLSVSHPDFHINLVIPMGGLGSRFADKGYSIPKPFLPIHGKSMYKWVIDNMLPTNPILRDKLIIHIIIREEHASLFTQSDVEGFQLHRLPRLTEGPACTVLSIKEIINTPMPLIIANSDQHLEWNIDEFYYSLLHPNVDGIISTFNQPDPTDVKWSYAKINESKQVIQVAEKRYISNNASTGIYGWARGCDFVEFAETMIEKNIRVNNEFYVCPVYNEAICSGKRIRIIECLKMWGLGVPADYEYFLAHWERKV